MCEYSYCYHRSVSAKCASSHHGASQGIFQGIAGHQLSQWGDCGMSLQTPNWGCDIGTAQHVVKCCLTGRMEHNWECLKGTRQAFIQAFVLFPSVELCRLLLPCSSCTAHASGQPGMHTFPAMPME